MTLIRNKKEFEKMEKKTLAKYAVLSAKSRGREFSEKEDLTRTAFERDRDRIIHCKAFRRLSGKTQVFVATYGDHFRDRLSHSLEVAQIARGMARALALNEDLAETIALAHDMGHTPFGHAGESALDSIMRKFGKRFEHNEQSKRIVEKLEKQFPNFDGLNLTLEVRQGLAKHQTLYDQKTRKISGKTLEAQVVDTADEIAYHNHDLDDGLRSLLFTFKDLDKVSLWKISKVAVAKKYGAKNDPVVMRHRIISHLISLMIADVLNNFKTGKNVIRFSPAFERKIRKLRKFLWNKMYKSPTVLRHSSRGQKILKKLFWMLYKNPKLMPKRFYERIGVEDPLEVVVKDYVAGCTDAYAEMLSLRGQRPKQSPYVIPANAGI